MYNTEGGIITFMNIISEEWVPTLTKTLIFRDNHSLLFSTSTKWDLLLSYPGYIIWNPF